MRKLINVSNRLPVTLEEEEIRKSSGGLVSALEGISGDYDLQWIGWPGAEVPDPERQRRVEEALQRDFGCLPIFLDAQEIAGFYEGFSNSSLWPLLHYMPSRFRYEPQWWERYHAVNQRFAQKVLEVADGDDLVWVHDYHLMLLPQMLREARPSLKIGFFLHTPFPSYESFRCHPKRGELAAGLLGADLIGFHTFGYLRHYCSATLRLLGLESEITQIHHQGRRTAVGVYPIGINAQRFEAELETPEFAGHLESFRMAHFAKRIILSVERMDYTKGILHRLDAIELFLAARENRDDVVFVFVSVPSRGGVEEYRNLIAEVEGRIGELNGRYATLHNSPIHFIHASIGFPELCALYAVADVALVTPLIDGMNLVSKEFVACQREDPGVLILSEFAGAAAELSTALIVNPYDAQNVAASITEALDMPEDERVRRMEPMRERVLRVNAQHWARRFTHELAATPTAPEIAAPGARKAVQRLSAALSQHKKIAMFLDYDGTLREIERDPAAARPNADTHALLRKLQNRSGVDVTVISGRTPEDLESFLGAYDFGLIAEHGAAIRRPGCREWERVDRNISYGWKEPILKLLRLYESSTPGSFVEQKRTSLVWHYRNTDPVYGSWKARELLTELAALTASEPLKVRQGKRIVEVTATQVNKGAAMLRVLDSARYDLVFCAGDDTTDEDMYQLDIPNLLSVHVGTEDTRAQFSVPTPAALRRLIEESLNAVSNAPPPPNRSALVPANPDASE